RRRRVDAQEGRQPVLPAQRLQPALWSARRCGVGGIRYQLRAGTRRGEVAEEGPRPRSRDPARHARRHVRRQLRRAAAGAALLRRRRSLDPRLRLPADRRSRCQGRGDRRRVPGDRERRVRALLPAELGRRGLRRRWRRLHPSVQNQRRRRCRLALEVAGRPGAAGSRPAGRLGFRPLLAHSSRDRTGPVKRALKWTAAALGALLVLLLGIAAWGVSTQSGTRSIARIAVDALGGKLALGQVEGTIAGPLTVTGLRYNDPEAGIDARLQRVYVDVVLTDLFRARVHVHDLQVSGVDVGLSEPTKPPEKSTKPFSLKPPIDVVIDSLALESARIHRDQALLVELTRAAFGGHWTSRDLAVKQLEVHSPQGKIEFAGSVRQRGIYMGGGHGSFRWKAGERSYAGTLETRSEAADATLLLKLTAPLDLELQAEVTQKKTWPWRFRLEVPRFDPREELLPSSSFTSLAASLSGHGSTDQGAISGKLVLNDEPLLIEPLRFIRNGDDVAIDSVLRISRANGGAIHLGGDVNLGREPVTAKVAATWNDIV